MGDVGDNDDDEDARIGLVLSCDPSRRNVAFCLLEPGAQGDASGDIIREWRSVEVPTKNAKDFLACVAAADILNWMDRCTHVLIERQMSSNPGLLRVQAYLEMLASSRGKRCAIVNERDKLVFAASSTWWEASGNKAVDVSTKISHYHRKRLCVGALQQFMHLTVQDPSFERLFVQDPEKAELANAVFQAMAWVHVSHPHEVEMRSAVVKKVKRHVRSKMPSPKQRQAGKLSPSNVAWMVRREARTKGMSTQLEVAHALHAAAEATTGLLRQAMLRHFKNPEYCGHRLAIPKAKHAAAMGYTPETEDDEAAEGSGGSSSESDKEEGEIST